MTESDAPSTLLQIPSPGRKRARISSVALLALVAVAAPGCAVHVSALPFQPSSAVRAKGTVSLEAVRYVPANGKQLAPNEFEFNKAGSIYFDIPLADHLRRCVTRELEASGMTIGEGGASLSIDITRYHLADKFTSLELYIESTWLLTNGDKRISRDLRAARRHFAYGNRKKAEDMNAMASELYESFFSDPEVKAILAGSRPAPAP